MKLQIILYNDLAYVNLFNGVFMFKLHKIFVVAMILSVLTGCARDLSSNTYTSDSTLSLTLEGKVVSARPVTIKENDKLSGNTGGMLAGGLLGGAIGTNIGKGGGRTVGVVGGALAGAAAGALIQDKLSTSSGIEYIVKLDMSKFKDGYYEGNEAMRNVLSTAKTSGMITVIQSSKDNVVREGQRVYVIFSNNRTRIIPAQ